MTEFLPDREGLADQGWLFLEPITHATPYYTYRNHVDAVFTGMNHLMPGGQEPLIVTAEQLSHTSPTTTTRSILYTTRNLAGAIVNRWSMPLATDSSAYVYAMKLNVTSDGLHIVTFVLDNGYLTGHNATLFRHSLTGALEGTYTVACPSDARYSAGWDLERAGGAQATSAFGFVYFAVPHYARDIILVAMADDMSRLSAKSIYFTYNVVMPTPIATNFCLMPYQLGITVMWKGAYGYPNTVPAQVPWAYWAQWQLKLTSGPLGVPIAWGYLPAPVLTPQRAATGYFTDAEQDDYGQVLAGCVDVDRDELQRNGNTQVFIASGYENDSAALGILNPVDPAAIGFARYDGTVERPATYQLHDYYGNTVGGMHQYNYGTYDVDYGEFGGPPPFSPSLQPLAPSKLLHAIRTYQGMALGIVTTKQVDDGDRPGVVPSYWDWNEEANMYGPPQPTVNPRRFINRTDVTVTPTDGFTFPDDTSLTYDDTFDRADDDYISQQYYWETRNDNGSFSDADWGIVGNTAYAIASVDADNNVVAYLDVETPTQDVAVTFAAVGTNYAIALRLEPTYSGLSYWYFYFGINAGYMFRNGTDNIGFVNVPAMTCVAGDTVRITANGDVFTVYRNGTQVAQFTNALNNESTCVGMAGIPSLDTVTRINRFKVTFPLEPFFRPWGDGGGVVLTDPWRHKAYVYASQDATYDQIDRLIDGIRVYAPYQRPNLSVAGQARNVLFHPRPTGMS